MAVVKTAMAWSSLFGVKHAVPGELAIRQTKGSCSPHLCVQGISADTALRRPAQLPASQLIV